MDSSEDVCAGTQERGETCGAYMNVQMSDMSDTVVIGYKKISL